MIQLNFKFFNVLCCFIVLFWFFLSVLHEIMPDLSCPSPLFAFILWLELASRRWQVMPSVLSGVPFMQAHLGSQTLTQICTKLPSPVRDGCLALHQGLLCWLQKGYTHHPPMAVPGTHAGTTELCTESGFSPLSGRNLDFGPYLTVLQNSKHRCV